MAGLAQANIVDLVGQDASGWFLLIIIESRPWGAEDAQASQLKAKINAYAGFIMDGSLVRRYPETAGRPVDIQLNCSEAPTGQFADIIKHATIQLQKLGIGFRVSIAAQQLI